MFRHVGRGAAILTTQRQALEDADGNQEDRREDPDRLIARQDANQEGGTAHHQQRDQKGILATDNVADPPKEGRAEWPRGEPGREGRQRREEGGGRVAFRKEPRREHDRQTVEDAEVLPSIIVLTAEAAMTRGTLYQWISFSSPSTFESGSTFALIGFPPAHTVTKTASGRDWHDGVPERTSLCGRRGWLLAFSWRLLS